MGTQGDLLPSGFYQMDYHCSNCGNNWTRSVPKGQLAGRALCPNCELTTGEKVGPVDYYPPGQKFRPFNEWEFNHPNLADPNKDSHPYRPQGTFNQTIHTHEGPCTITCA